MAAYAIFIREGEIVDQEAMDAYRSGGVRHPDMTPLVIYGDMETIEGEAADGIVILQFPDMATAREWYFGEYNEKAKLRQKAAPYRGFLVEGL